MKARVHYVSPKGSAETIAEAIARECKCAHGQYQNCGQNSCKYFLHVIPSL